MDECLPFGQGLANIIIVKLPLIAAGLLGGIHGEIGMMDDFFGTSVIERIDADPDARAERQSEFPPMDIPVYCFHHSLGDGLHFADVGHILREHHEFIARIAQDTVFAAQGAA